MAASGKLQSERDPSHPRTRDAYTISAMHIFGLMCIQIKDQRLLFLVAELGIA